MARERWAIATATLGMHLAVAGRYDFFRDELYFIACGRRAAFGYVDQPPVVPWLAAASQSFGEHLVLMRAISALAAAVTVWVVMSLARLVGAGRFGVVLAGVAAAVAPMYLGVMTTLNTSTFEACLWTALALFVARGLLLEDRRAWIWAGVIVGVDLEIKYALPIYLVPLSIAIVATGNARVLWRREVAIGSGIAIAIAAPSVIWQLAHGLPFVEMIHNQSKGKNVALPPLAFIGQQILTMNPLLMPVWLAGVVAPFVDERFKRVRVFSVAFVIAFVALMLLHAKDYYVSPLYGVMFAVGGAAIEGWLRARWPRAVYVFSAVAMSAIIAPLAMPILPPPLLVRYIHALHLAPKATETLRQSELPQTFADMVGWRSYVASVTAAVRALPPDEQKRVVILARNYGEAGALEFYGRGLPPVVSGHNQYGMWATRGLDPDVLLAINRDVDEVKDNCPTAQVVGRFGAPYVMPFENDAPITLCRGLHPSLARIWPEIKFYY